MGQALDRMEALLDGYAGDRAAAGQFVEYVKGCFPGREEEALYGLSSHGLVQLQSLLEKRLNQSRTEVQAQLKRKSWRSSWTRRNATSLWIRMRRS
jgi:hypothetical protein